jgi:coproporphyrinogen III oxidase
MRARAFWLLLSSSSAEVVVTSFTNFATTVQQLQSSMIAKAKLADPRAVWTVDEHSRGCAVIIEDGDVWEKGCISVTLIEDGVLSTVRAETISGRTGTTIAEGSHYSACALSFVLHARSPLVPTLRGDCRVFVVGEDEWYGGGLDLTPSYVDADDCTHFHAELCRLCNLHGTPTTYAEMKATCDDYFYLPARGEHRGVGGVFFDDLKADWAPVFAEALLDSALAEDGPYMPIVRRRLPLECSEAQKQWQLLRRGRYIEFNLLYDRGVKFGLSPESVERVLVSSPPLVAFKYKAEPLPGTAEAETLEVLRRPREWVSLGDQPDGRTADSR